MFSIKENFQYKYTPILSLSPSEMEALEQLPNKDKDAILPVIPLKGWMSSQTLDNSLKKIKKTIGDRKWVASIDYEYLLNNKKFLLTGTYPREVFNQLLELKDSKNGYLKWYEFLEKKTELIPSVIIEDLTQIDREIGRLITLKRGLAFIFEVKKLSLTSYYEIMEILSKHSYDDLFFIYDLGTISSNFNDFCKPLVNLINKTKSIIPSARISISGTSFPSNFSGYTKGENPIYERRLFNIVKQEITAYPLVYSDRGSARLDKQSGGGNLPPPRIDFALKHDWRFIRREFNDPKSPDDGEKEQLYYLCAKEIMLQDYWPPNLHLWGTQMIELTSKKEMFGINTPQKATAVRINIHLYTQLHYDDVLENIDTDEDWED